VQKTPAVIVTVGTTLPAKFPAHVANSILAGLLVWPNESLPYE
jgi:hypothetical protein